MDEDKNGLLQNPLVRKLIGLSIFVAIYLVIGFFIPDEDPAVDHSLAMLADAVLCMVGLVLWMIFFAQFVLPVKSFQARGKVVERLVAYIFGGHGPAIFVENGFTRTKDGELKKKGPGVIWLDSASAAVLRTASRFTRTIGPGVHFTGFNEYIAATTDLHTITQSIGPNDTDEPFKMSKDDPNYKAVKERAEATTGMTRDGIPVCATISVNFRIKSTPGEGNTRFGFNPQHTEAAIRDSMVREANLDHPIWNTLPARMAADLWREYLGKFRLSELYETSDKHVQDTTLQYITEMMKKRLTRSRVEVLDAFGQVLVNNSLRGQEYDNLIARKHYEAAEVLLRKEESLEFIKLSDMGLEVKSINIKRLFFAPDIDEQLVNQWTALWLKNAQKERAQVELDRKLSETSGQQQALKDYALSVSAEISKQSPEDAAGALELLVHATLSGARKSSGLLKRINNELRDLSEIYGWLKNLKGPLQ